MSEVGRTINYLFWLGFALVILAYWAGANQLLQTAFSGVNTLDKTATGRDASGAFANYPV